MVNDETDGEPRQAHLSEAEDQFRAALQRTHRNRDFIGEVESAAAQFCRMMREQGHAPEQTLKDAKRVIQETIDNENIRVAERAVQICIQHYFRGD